MWPAARLRMPTAWASPMTRSWPNWPRSAKRRLSPAPSAGTGTPSITTSTLKRAGITGSVRSATPRLRMTAAAPAPERKRRRLRCRNLTASPAAPPNCAALRAQRTVRPMISSNARTKTAARRSTSLTTGPFRVRNRRSPNLPASNAASRWPSSLRAREASTSPARAIPNAGNGTGQRTTTRRTMTIPRNKETTE